MKTSQRNLHVGGQHCMEGRNAPVSQRRELPGCYHCLRSVPVLVPLSPTVFYGEEKSLLEVLPASPPPRATKLYVLLDDRIRMS